MQPGFLSKLARPVRPGAGGKVLIAAGGRGGRTRSTDSADRSGQKRLKAARSGVKPRGRAVQADPGIIKIKHLLVSSNFDCEKGHNGVFFNLNEAGVCCVKLCQNSVACS